VPFVALNGHEKLLGRGESLRARCIGRGEPQPLNVCALSLIKRALLILVPFAQCVPFANAICDFCVLREVTHFDIDHSQFSVALSKQ
jgi:hypothetical protein